MRPAAARARLTSPVRRQLRTLVRTGATPQKVARRAQTMLLADEGVSNTDIAIEVGLSRQAVISLRKRFDELGVHCVLRDAPRPGRKRKVTKAQARAVVEKTLYTKPKNATHWSTRSMAKATGYSNATIQRIWSAHGLKPHVTRTFKLSNDPDFVKKLRDIVGLYLNPPDRALVLSVDEKSQIQALDRTQPALPLGKGGRQGADGQAMGGFGRQRAQKRPGQSVPIGHG